MSDPARRVALADAAATAGLGAALARAIDAASASGCTVLLRGDLGAGKTTLARGFLRALGHDDPVPSPTYTLLEPYQFGALRVSHLDLYRLADETELEFLGWRDLADSVCLVEWPERAPRVARDADLAVTLAMAGSGRSALLEAMSSTGAAVLDRFDAAGGDHQI